MFSKVSVAGALLLESHSWYLTQVLSRSSIKPFSWELQEVEEGGKSQLLLYNSRQIVVLIPKRLHPNAHIYTDTQTAEQELGEGRHRKR